MKMFYGLAVMCLLATVSAGTIGKDTAGVVPKESDKVMDILADAGKKEVEKVTDEVVEKVVDAAKKDVEKVTDEVVEKVVDAAKKDVEKVTDKVVEKVTDAGKKVATGICECAAFLSEQIDADTKPLGSKPVSFQPTCDAEGKESCSKMCMALAQAHHEKSPEQFCEKVGTNLKGLKPAVFYKACDDKTWSPTGMAAKQPYCCQDGKNAPCPSDTKTKTKTEEIREFPEKKEVPVSTH